MMLDDNCNFEFKVKSLEDLEVNEAADFAAIFGFIDEDNYYYVMFNTMHMQTAVYRVTPTERQLVQKRYGSWITDNEYHTVQLTCDSSNVWVYLDSTAVFYCDSLETGGKVGFGSFNDAAMFDDVIIRTEPQQEEGVLGDVNDDGIVNSTDALIILSCDVGMDVTAYCPMPCGDVNLDGAVNSTDALIILSCETGIEVPYPVGEPGCPENPTPCLGCD
ncbi:hypothetical protein HQ585_07620 [candidate division KSB1 bacterium]|nr:hypothetical protein [candidate division KSB1 bacterium]